MPPGARRSLAPLALAALTLLAGAPARAQLPGEAPPHRYAIVARLDPETHEVSGTVAIAFRNTSRKALDELVFHLYMNAFEGPDTVFMEESSGQLRGVAAEGEGSIEVETLYVGGVDRLAAADDELIEGDHTQLSVPLQSPLAPGEALDLELTFTTRLPPLFARAGHAGDFHVVAQFFPKLAKLEPDGSWASFPYHGNGEFYADFARYELTVDVPEGWRVGATGTMVADEREGSRRVLRFEATWVHDAAFVAAPWFEERLAAFASDEGDVAIRILHPPGYGSAAERHLEVTRAGLAHYGAFLGPYPYPGLTVVVPPRGAEGGAGMEYPTMFLTAGPWLALPSLPFAAQDEVTAHELGHQWFQGMVATNEVAHPMLDEGLTEWITGDLLAELHGRRRSGIALPFLQLDGFAIRRAAAFAGSRTPPPASPAPTFGSSSAYGRAVYFRTASVVETVARTWGRDRLRRTLGRYAMRHRFGHPEPADLWAAFDETYGPWMASRVLRPALERNAVAAVRVTRFEPGGDGASLEVHRVGGLPLPVRLRVQRQEGTEWIDLPGRERSFVGRLRGDVRSVRADPHRRSLLDPSRLDDAAGEDEGGDRFAKALHFFQTLIGAFGP